MEKIWTAKWIMDKQFYGLKPINLFHKAKDKITLPEHKPELKNHHMLVRKKFNIEEDIGECFLDITADDYYKLYINNKFVGQGPAPAYHYNYNVNRYNVTEYLKKGANVISVHVYYQGLVNRVWNSGDYRQGMIAELYRNNELLLLTDSTWKYTLAKEFVGTETIGYETQFVEDIDSRLKDKHWKEIDYDDSNWENVVENNIHDYKFVMQITPPLQIYEIKPAYVKIKKGGHFFIDFGQEIVGQFKMAAKGTTGQEVIIKAGEELIEGTKDKVRYQMRCNCNYKETWILSGGNDILEQYDYKGFRYVEVEAPEGVINPDSFRAVVRHYPLDENACKFESSDPLLNEVWRICRNGVKYGTQEAYLDCPTREKGQYIGDCTVTGHSHIYISGDLRLYKKALIDFANTRNICPGLMAVAPGGKMQEIADYSLQWPLQLLTYYKQSGDIKFLKEMYPVADGIIKYFEKYQRDDGLIENVKEKWNLVDWPQNLRDGYDFDLSSSTSVGDGCHNVINAFYCGAVKIVNEIREILGIEYNDSFPQLKESFFKAFYNKEANLFADSTVTKHTALHSNIIPLFFGLVPEEMYGSVVELVKKKGMHCGVYITYFLLKGLASIGEYELVYKLLTSEDEYSWLNMVREGGTTCFEAWGKEHKWNTSLCHPWASSPISVIIEDIAGLKPAKPGWEEIQFTPHIPENVDKLSLEINTVRGRIALKWENGKSSINIFDNI